MADPDGTCSHCHAPTWEGVHADGIGCYEAWADGAACPRPAAGRRVTTQGCPNRCYLDGRCNCPKDEYQRSTPMTVVAHGTNAGYQRHRRRGDQACQPCREAHSAYARLRRSVQSPLHGTKRGVRLHLRYGSPVCEACIEWACQVEAERARSYYDRFYDGEVAA